MVEIILILCTLIFHCIGSFLLLFFLCLYVKDLFCCCCPLSFNIALSNFFHHFDFLFIRLFFWFPERRNRFSLYLQIISLNLNCLFLLLDFSSCDYQCLTLIIDYCSFLFALFFICFSQFSWCFYIFKQSGLVKTCL